MEHHVKTKIQQILNAFETGSAEGDYGAISVFADAAGERKQYTIGRSQTTESGFLKIMLQNYVKNKGIYANEMSFFADKIQPHNGRGAYSKSIYPSPDFEKLIRKAAKDPIMKSTQDVFFDERYWAPAYKFFIDNGFRTPLAMLTIYDTAIHSGPALNSHTSMMYVLRQRFGEKTPINGGDEKKWVAAYVNARHKWLANHPSRPILRKTIYRTNTLKKLIADNNWELTGNINANGVTIKDQNPPTTKTANVLPPTPVVVKKLSLWDKIKAFFN